MNTIAPEAEEPLPGDRELERLATALVRWNAIAIVLQANAESTELGGHIASYQSAETLYEVGFNHFWRARSEEHGGDSSTSRATPPPASEPESDLPCSDLDGHHDRDAALGEPVGEGIAADAY